MGGCDLISDCRFPDVLLQAYDPATNTWSRLADMHTHRAFLAAAAGSDGKIYAIGGFSVFVDILDSVEVYNPATDTWTFVAHMPTARYGLAAAAGPDGRIYALGGTNQTSTFLDTAEAYNPPGNTWVSIASMPTARRDLAATTYVFFGVTTIYAIGGHGVQFPLATMEVYFP